MFLSRIKTFIIDLIFPVFCLGCQKEGIVFCDDCLNKLEVNTKPFCPVCKFRLANERTGLKNSQRPVLGKLADLHRNCRNKTNLKKLITATSYSNPIIRKLIDTYKYQFVRDLDQPLSQLIVKSIFPILSLRANPPAGGEAWQSEFIITSVPLHKKRFQWRGFNQAELLGKKIGQELKIDFQDLLKRTKNTDPQVKVNFEERKANIIGAFAIKEGIDLNKKIVFLVDDVYTSGSTMNECAQVLKNAGAKEVWGVVIAK